MRPDVERIMRACVAQRESEGLDRVPGQTELLCLEIKAMRDAMCEARTDALDEGELPMPGGSSRLGGERKSERQREFDSLAAERNKYHTQSQDLEKKLAAIAMLVSIFERQRENEPDEGWPEGDLHPSQVLQAIGETIGQQCSICRSRHGSEVQHACE